MRFLWLTLAALIMLGAAQPGQALGRGLMLDEPPTTDFTVYGWTFLVLSLGMLSYAQQSYTASQEALTSADASYTSYQGAATLADANTFRAEAEGFLATAENEELRANGALFLTVLFGLTAYYSFFPDHAPDTTILIKPRGIALLHRF